MPKATRPNLDRRVDPKLAWALHHRELFPVDVNRAPREMLLRIPGVGDRTVTQILQTRRRRAVSSVDLRKLRLPWHRVRYFVSATDHHPRPRAVKNSPRGPRPALERQMDLFELASTTRASEL